MTLMKDLKLDISKGFNFVDLFCGIGGFHQAMADLGGVDETHRYIKFRVSCCYGIFLRKRAMFPKRV